MIINIIGAGIGGIATAIRLRYQGHKVNVYEANSYCGGKLTEIKNQGYRFDAGPSLFTMPTYVDELFELFSENSRDYFDYISLEKICNYFWEDGTRITAFKDFEKLYQELHKKLGIERKELEQLFQKNALKYNLTGKIFLEQSIHQWKTWFSKDVVKALFNFHHLDIFKTMHQVHLKNISHPKLVQFFDRFATYNGSNPYKASGILNMIPHLEHYYGAFFPKGGMISIINSLVELAQRKGVVFHLNKKVEKIIIKNKKAVGIQIEDQFIPSDIVISNMDIYPTYKNLLPLKKIPKKVIQNERSSSALIFYWGIQKEFQELDLHNIFFSDNYQKEFDEITQGKVYEDPTIYINISSKYNKNDAPKNCENWFTMINVPYDNGQDWDSIIFNARKNIIKKINRILNINLESLIECESILDPKKIMFNTSSFGGSLYGTASNDRMAAFNRHANFSSHFKNLYFCGGSVHPGGGIPLCLLSAKIVSELIKK